MADERPMRLCDVCLGYDDHPRHVIALEPNSTAATPSADFIASLPDGMSAYAMTLVLQPNLQVRHMDCCAAQGCPDCLATESANGGARGQKLIDHLEAVRSDGG